MNHEHDEPIFEVEVGEHFRIKFNAGFYVPVEINELMKWYFEDNEYLLLMTNHLIELIINLLSVKYETIMPIHDQDHTNEDIFHDLKLLKKNQNFMETFYNIQDFVETNFDLFYKLEIT